MNPIPKTKIIRLKGQKLAKLNERIHQRDQHKGDILKKDT